MSTITTNKSSPRLCLLLKTLLFLLCIYIKRVTATSSIVVTEQPYYVDQYKSLGATHNHTLIFEPKYATDGDTAYALLCPIDGIILKKNGTKESDSKYITKLRAAIKKKAEVTWFKDGDPLHRQNGNPIYDQLKTDAKTLILLSVGPSDQGSYTCVVNYTNVPKNTYQYLDLYPGATFDLMVDSKSSIAPDKKPTISHPPTDLLVKRGSNVTFTCTRGETLSQQST